MLNFLKLKLEDLNIYLMMNKERILRVVFAVLRVMSVYFLCRFIHFDNSEILQQIMVLVVAFCWGFTGYAEGIIDENKYGKHR